MEGELGGGWGRSGMGARVELIGVVMRVAALGGEDGFRGRWRCFQVYVVQFEEAEDTPG